MSEVPLQRSLGFAGAARPVRGGGGEWEALELRVRAPHRSSLVFGVWGLRVYCEKNEGCGAIKRKLWGTGLRV